MKNSVKVLVIYTILITSSFAGLSDVCEKYKEDLRPFFSSIFGEELSLKIFGPLPETIVLPPIPQIRNDATKLSENKNQDSDPKLTNVPKDKLMDYDIIFLHELFETTISEKISDEDLATWMNALTQGSAREGIYRAIVFGGKYASFEQNSDPKSLTTDEAKKFATYFLQKYVGEKHQENAFKNLNIYSTKRICVEKALEIIDLLIQQNPTDLENWYAVLSSDLSVRFPNIWGKSKLRSDSSLEIHKHWANKAPIQFLKSEVILKLHMSFNSLL
ncbi:MAG: hypothetical protein U0T83_05960 [Bacteriovoracaceae bacterium]